MPNQPDRPREIADAMTTADEAVELLRSLSFEMRTAVVTRAGLHLACCATCGCYLGAPYCHPSSEATQDHDDTCPCPTMDDDEDDEDE